VTDLLETFTQVRTVSHAAGFSVFGYLITPLPEIYC